MSDMTIQQVLAQMRQLKIEAGADVQAAEGAGKPGFAELLNRSIEQVSDNQAESGRMSAAFERGDPGVDLASVMIAGQKSRISFEAMMQVRNRLVEAYREIQNMPI